MLLDRLSAKSGDPGRSTTAGAREKGDFEAKWNRNFIIKLSIAAIPNGQLSSTPTRATFRFYFLNGSIFPHPLPSKPSSETKGWREFGFGIKGATVCSKWTKRKWGWWLKILKSFKSFVRADLLIEGCFPFSFFNFVVQSHMNWIREKNDNCLNISLPNRRYEGI